MTDPAGQVRGIAVGFDRSDPAVLQALSASVASLARRVNAIGVGRLDVREPEAVKVQRRLRGADPRRLIAIHVAAVDVADAVTSIEDLHGLGSWPPDATSALVFVRDALRLLADRLAALDRIDEHDEKPVQVSALLAEARRRLRQAQHDNWRSADAREAAERAIHLAATRRLLRACSALSRLTEIATYERG